MKFSILASSVLVAVASAVKITSQPGNQNNNVDQSQPVTVTWTTVSTDPSQAHLVLSRAAGGQSQYRYDFGLVNLSAGSYTISKVALPDGSDFQFNFENPPGQNNMGIIAQSGQFTISGSASGATLTLPTAGTTGSATGTAVINSGSGAATSTGSSSGSASTTVTTSTTSTSSGSTSSTTTTSGAVTTATKNAGSVNTVGSSMFALLVGAAAALF